MATLQEVLDDPKTFEDGIELEIKGVKTTLGDLRGLSSAQQKKISASLADAESKRNAAIADAEKAAAILNGLQTLEKETKETRTAPVGDEDDFDTNNWWTPVRKRLNPLEEQNKALQKQVKDLADSIGRAATIWAEDRWHGQYDRMSDRLKKSSKHKDMTYEQVRDYAAQQKLLDSYGFPSVEKAIMDLTKEDDIERIRREAHEAGVKEGATRARLGANPRPTSASGGRQQTKGLDPTKNLEDLGDAIVDDPELSEMLASLQGVSADDFVQ